MPLRPARCVMRSAARAFLASPLRHLSSEGGSVSDPFDLHIQGGPAALPQKDLSRAGVTGTTCGGVECFYGIRYGRLSKPDTPRSAVTPASGQLDVRHLTEVPVFPQLPSRLEALMGPGIGENPQSDEAFYLNVWTPEGGTDLPVMVFLHGGAWVSGGGAARWYRGAALAAEGMVVVTLNYRIGPNGHLEEDADQDPSDHRPMGDILTALQWVKDHICDFGGDANRITLAGQSAGHGTLGPWLGGRKPKACLIRLRF
ncbi:hypothetical protein DA792_01405 (plasmid) [Celeribacter baekdonensis]|uniref:Carboxylic ester hydrolase n=1 Tax=Celeribacter baekdonensis TaxID=875171 RepID=A0A2R4LYC1_9RHOB|nr:hypothetical protein DA792_01405 [Celeribacter baekdonensis]